MAPVDHSGTQQLPAVDPKLAIYIETANACLKAWARAKGQKWDAMTDADALLLQALLAKSKPKGKDGVVPILPLSEFKGLLNEALTERRWVKFLRWFSQEIASDLAKTCEERAEPMLYPARSSTGTGGRGPKGQAIYFLSFATPPELENSSAADAPTPKPVERQHQKPETATAPLNANAEQAPQGANEPPAQAEAGNPGGKSDSRDKEPRPEQPRQPLDQAVPLGIFLGMRSANPSGISVGWMATLALILIVATSTEPASTPLVDEIVRILSAVREALSGDVIVRL